MRVNPKSFWLASVVLAASAVWSVPAAFAQAAGQPAAAASASTVDEWAGRLWQAAKSGDKAGFERLLASLPADASGAPAALAAAVTRLREHLAWRETERAKRADEVRAEMAKALADDKGDTSLSKAMVSAMELTDLVKDKKAILNDPAVKDLIVRADAAARDAEKAGKWLIASELFVRLQILHEETPQAVAYKDAVDRVSHRLSMLRLYTPKRLWDLQNERRLASEGKPLPPYNALGDDFNEKLQGITELMVREALGRSAMGHVDQGDMRKVILDALDGVRTLVTTTDLREAFPGLASDADREAMLAAVSEEEARITADKDVTLADLDRTLNRVVSANNATVKVSPTALLHEFGNGGINALDEFTAVVWPYEVARFNKMIAGSFAGVGAQLEYDDTAKSVRVVTPLYGTPAHKAGIKADDLITKVDGKSVYGLAVDGVVDLITGPQGTNVKLTIERKTKAAEGQEPGKQELEFELKRKQIEVVSVRGWRRTGEKESDWDWFVDPVGKIAYMRISGFTDKTGAELDAAARAARQQGAKGLVLDLRFNPGGLLDQGIKVAQEWVDKGNIVLTQNAGKTHEVAGQGNGTARLNDLPTVVLVNRGSASASEIVSGALQFYGNKGDVPVMLLGQRSYGKGSVQQVYDLPGRKARLKLTCQYYLLPDMRIIHRRPGAEVWGVDPNLEVEMLPKQIGDAVTLRKNADVLPDAAVTAVNPDDLLAKNLDLQLEAALVLLEARSYGGAEKQANAGK